MNTFNKDRLYAENEDLKERIIELESKLHQWISVEDKLPDDNSMVVAACGYEYSEPDAAVCNFYSGRFCLNTDGLDASNYDGGAVITMIFNVTHWIPLPDVIKRR